MTRFTPKETITGRGIEELSENGGVGGRVVSSRKGGEKSVNSVGMILWEKI